MTFLFNLVLKLFMDDKNSFMYLLDLIKEEMFSA